jgi:uncharacterized protein YnzC (UPF0291/DUF896 family)
MCREELEKILEKMDEGNSIIGDILQDIYLKDYFEQNISQAIMRVKAIGNDVTPENILKNLREQLILMVHLHNTAMLVYDEYQKIVDFFKEKIASQKEGETEKG